MSTLTSTGTVGVELRAAPAIASRLRWPDPRRSARRAWWAVAAALSLPLLGLGVSGHWTEASLTAFVIAVLARHDGVVAALSRLTVRHPGQRRHQMIYHLGQLHRAMAMLGVVLLLVATATLAGDAVGRLVLAAVTAGLALMAWTARDAVRGGRHNRFEAIHRYGGWAVLIVLAGLVGARAATDPVATLPSACVLVTLVLVVLHPWLGVRSLPVEVLDVTPALVVLALPGERTVGEFVRISLDGREWHAFAVSTSGAEGPGRYSVVIRRTGDWTEELGRRAAGGRPPTRMLVRRIRGYGFMGHAQTYARVLVVATGAGIGPVLPYLLDRDQSGLECLWIGRAHRATVGSDLVDRVVASGRTTLIDTAAGRPDLASLVALRAPHVDAVFVVSNAPVRDQIARACAQLDLPWYGPTFDS